MKLKDLKPVYIKGKPPKIKEGEYLLPYLTPEYIRSGATPEYYPKQEGVALVEDGDLILLWDGSNAGEFFRGKRGILSSTMVKIAPIAGTHGNYIYYSLKLQEPSLKSKTAGSGIPHVDKEAFFNLEIFLPETRHQSTIATILSTIDQAIEKTERLITKYERIKTGLMQDLLTRGIDEQGRIRREETHAFKDSPLGRVPVEWEVKRFNELYEMKSGGTPSRKAFEKYYLNGEVFWVKTLDLNERYIVSSDERITQIALEESSCTIFPENTVLIAMYGGWEQIGRTSILKVQAATNQAITALINPKEEVCSEYVQLCLQNLKYKWKKFAVSTRKDPNITKTDIGNFMIPFPSFDEQIEIVNRVAEATRKIEVEKHAKNKYEALKTALMQDLLTGKVRVDALMNGATDIH